MVKHFNSCSTSDAIGIILERLNLPEHSLNDFDCSYKQQQYYFDYNKYVNRHKEEVEAIFNYAKTRRINTGFLPGVYFTRVFHQNGDYTLVRNPSLMFLHVNKDLKICGAKFRNINDNINPRFTARGDLGFYILESNPDEKINQVEARYLCESETSANSLCTYLVSRKIQAKIISTGGVSSVPRELPHGINDVVVFLIIDFDGNEELYQERIEKYKHLNVKPIKIELPKGEDINSLYCQDKMSLIEHLII